MILRLLHPILPFSTQTNLVVVLVVLVAVAVGVAILHERLKK